MRLLRLTLVVAASSSVDCAGKARRRTYFFLFQSPRWPGSALRAGIDDYSLSAKPCTICSKRPVERQTAAKRAGLCASDNGRCLAARTSSSRHGNQARKPGPWQPSHRRLMDSTVGILAASAILCFASMLAPERAIASYAPSSAAVTSSLPARKLNLEELENLKPQKALQREKALGIFSVTDLLEQLDAQLEKLQLQAQEMEQGMRAAEKTTESDTAQGVPADLRRKAVEQPAEVDLKREEIERELALKRKFESELRTRAETLRKLDAQPAWLNYLAAAAASVVSTIIMHPVDTIKTRMITSAANVPHNGPSSEDDDGTAAGTPSIPPTFGKGQVYDVSVLGNGGDSGSIGAPRSDNGREAEEFVRQPERELAVLSSSSSTSLPSSSSGYRIEESSPTSRRDTQPSRFTVVDNELERGSALRPDESVDSSIPAQKNGAMSPSSDDDAEARLHQNPFESWKSLYAGVGGNVAKEAMPSALYLGVYEAVKARLVDGHVPLLLAYLIAGGAGEMCGSVIRAPAEAFKSLAQSGLVSTSNEVVEYLIKSPKSRKRLLRAWASSVLRDVPMGAIQIAIFEGLKLYILNSPTISVDVNTLQAEAAIGAVGGLVGAYLTTPTDITTTRIITSGEGEVKGPWDILVDIWKYEGGLTGVFQGSFQRSLYWAPAIGIFLSCYCSIRQFAADNPTAHEFVNAISAALSTPSSG